MAFTLHGSAVDYPAFHSSVVFLEHLKVYETVVHGYFLSYLNFVDNVLVIDMNRGFFNIVSSYGYRNYISFAYMQVQVALQNPGSDLGSLRVEGPAVQIIFVFLDGFIDGGICR